MPDDDVRVEREGRVAIVTLDRPSAHNAVTMAMQERLDVLLGELSADDGVGCVVLTGAGEKAFSAGYDLPEMADWGADALLLSLVAREGLLRRVAEAPVPIVCALNGLAYGVGAIIASAVDVRIGVPHTRFRFTAGAHGGANATWSLPHVVGHARAAEILMTAREVGAEEAERIGLLTRVVEPSDLRAAALETAGLIAANPPDGVRVIKRLLREGEGRAPLEAFEAENRMMRTVLRPKPVREVYDATGDDRSRRAMRKR